MNTSQVLAAHDDVASTVDRAVAEIPLSDFHEHSLAHRPACGDRVGMRVAYLINQYPQPSHTFIRREIAALEALGLVVFRYSLRAWGGTLCDDADEAERKATRVVLQVGAIGLLAAVARAAIGSPRAFARALGLALEIGRRSDRGLFAHVVYLAEACILKRWLAECGASHVHAHFGTNSAAVAMLCRVLGGPPYSVTIHGPEEFDSPRALSLRDKVRHAAFVAAVSEFGRSQLYRWADYADWPKIRIIRCGVDGRFLDAEPVPIADVPRLVCVGRLVAQKGQIVLVQAVALLRDRGIPLDLVLVGEGPMRAEIERAIRHYGLSSRVRLVGWKGGDDVRREILASRALVLASFAEGLPVVLMEALALGRPVISTTIAGIPELVRPGSCGWLVAPGSVEGLAAAMQEALAMSTVKLEQMGRNGAARVAARHDARDEARRLAEDLGGRG